MPGSVRPLNGPSLRVVMSICFGFCLESSFSVPLSELSVLPGNSMVYLSSVMVNFIPLKSSLWSRSARTASSRIHTPSNVFKSASGSAASAAEEKRKVAATAIRSVSIALSLLAVDQCDGFLKRLERLAAGEQLVEPRAGFNRVETQPHQRFVHIFDEPTGDRGLVRCGCLRGLCWLVCFWLAVGFLLLALLLFNHRHRARCCCFRLRRRTHHRELSDLPLQCGHDLLSGCGSDTWQGGEPLHVLPADCVGNVLHRPGHRFERFLRADLLNSAEPREEIQLGFRVKADSPRNEPAAAGVSFQVFHDVECDLLTPPQLEPHPHGFRDQHLILERSDLKPGFVVEYLSENAGHLGNHADSPLMSSSVRSSGSVPKSACMFTPVKVTEREPLVMLPLAK